MTLDDAISEIAERAAVKIDVAAKGAFTLCSGGRLVDGDMPAFYLNESLAVETWLEAVVFELGPNFPKKSLTWVDYPKMEIFQITIMDRRGTHRLANDRFVVRSKLLIEEKAEAVAEVAAPAPTLSKSTARRLAACKGA